MSIAADVEKIDRHLLETYDSKMVIQSSLTRQLVSFQASKNRPVDRWFRYKEAFSSELVAYFLNKYNITDGVIFDPFAGIGTTLFAASKLGLAAHGIELLPIGQEIVSTRLLLQNNFTSHDFDRLKSWAINYPWRASAGATPLPTLRITEGAYSPETTIAIGQYLNSLPGENDKVQRVLRFALLCVLEAVSFTRKDGQYLRWDYRSNRRQSVRPFDKGLIPNFDNAITRKIREILDDSLGNNRTLPMFESETVPLTRTSSDIALFAGSCLDLLPAFSDNQFEAIITSPPYCNRYDYTRTYALELALLGVDELHLVKLRQAMLSCTVENRPKDLMTMNPHWGTVIEIADRQELLQAVLRNLELQNMEGRLNNRGIPRMVRGYFYEMACVIAESARVLKKNALLVMVNDNVRYAGGSISVDLILAEIASQLGFSVESILVLSSEKGNSSQQMGLHGRDGLRKCIYVWRKR